MDRESRFTHTIHSGTHDLTNSSVNTSPGGGTFSVDSGNNSVSSYEGDIPDFIAIDPSSPIKVPEARDPYARLTDTSEMAFFLKNTGPPMSAKAADRELDSSRTSAKHSLAVFRLGKFVTEGSKDRRAADSAAKTALKTNDSYSTSVVQRRTTDGKRYLQILPVFDKQTSAGDDLDSPLNSTEPPRLHTAISERTETVPTDTLDGLITDLSIDGWHAETAQQAWMVRPKDTSDNEKNQNVVTAPWAVPGVQWPSNMANEYEKNAEIQQACSVKTSNASHSRDASVQTVPEEEKVGGGSIQPPNSHNNSGKHHGTRPRTHHSKSPARSILKRTDSQRSERELKTRQRKLHDLAKGKRNTGLPAYIRLSMSSGLEQTESPGAELDYKNKVRWETGQFDMSNTLVIEKTDTVQIPHSSTATQRVARPSPKRNGSRNASSRRTPSVNTSSSRNRSTAASSSPARSILKNDSPTRGRQRHRPADRYKPLPAIPNLPLVKGKSVAEERSVGPRPKMVSRKGQTAESVSSVYSTATPLPRFDDLPYMVSKAPPSVPAQVSPSALALAKPENNKTRLYEHAGLGLQSFPFPSPPPLFLQARNSIPSAAGSMEGTSDMRVEALERENRLLEAALMAVLKTGGQMNGCPCGLGAVTEHPGNLSEPGHLPGVGLVSPEMLPAHLKPTRPSSALVTTSFKKEAPPRSTVKRSMSPLSVYLQTRAQGVVGPMRVLAE